MSNTLIQIKRSTTTATPPDGSLAAGVPAYSYSSNTLFIGTPDGLGVIAIGGKYYLDTITAAYQQANAAYNAANTGLSVGAAFNKANTANITADLAYGQANAAYAKANTANLTADTAFTHANNAYAKANAANLTADAAFVQANTARSHANAAFEVANTKLDAAGGTVTGNLAVTGSLTVVGNVYLQDTETLRISDPLLYLAGNNYVSDIVDIGFVGNYVNATGWNVHTGVIRDAITKEYYIFEGYDKEPGANSNIDTAGNNFTLSVLNATLRTSNIILGGANAILTIGASFDHANAAHVSANAALILGNAAFLQANTAHDHANNAFARANTANITADLAFTHANNAYAKANTANITADLAFGQANTAWAAANAASAQAANADFLTSGTVASARLSGAYTGITGVGTLTQGVWNASTVAVPYGGTGMVTFTTNGILYGNSAGDLKVTAAGTEGQVLQATSTGVPQFAMLDGGTF